MTPLKPTTQVRKLLVTSVISAGLLLVPVAGMPIPVEAVAPGYSGMIAFVSTRDGNDEIYVMAADGSNQTRLTDNAVVDKDPAWSPDGTQIAFLTNRDGNDEIYIMDANGGNPVRLTNNPASDGSPSWSSDGTKIAFVSNRDGNKEIYSMKVDGSDVRRLTNNVGDDYNISWFPNDTQLLFESRRTGHSEIYVMDFDGSNVVQITNNTYSSTAPKLSPDGSKIVYADGAIGGNYELYKINTDGSSPVRLTDNGENESPSTWSPDGKKLAFMRTISGVNSIYSMNADGSNQAPITAGADLSRAPSWQPIPNASPSVSDDILTTAYNTAGSVDVLANDTDEEALDPDYLRIASQPSQGTAAIESGKVKYTPNSGSQGSDQLTYQICDSFLLDQKCATGVLGITVQAPGAPSLAVTKVGRATYTSGTATYTSDSARPIFSGTATPGSTIKVEIHSAPIVLTTTAAGDGNWSVAPNQDIPAGEHTVVISATKDGVTTTLDQFVLAISTATAAELPITGTNAEPLRWWGMGIMAVGVGLGLKRRRSARRSYGPVPPLFP